MRSGLSQKDVAQALGYTSAQFISNWERGLCSPPLNALATITDLYSLNAKELIQIIIEEQESVLKDALLSSGSKKKKRA